MLPSIFMEDCGVGLRGREVRERKEKGKSTLQAGGRPSVAGFSDKMQDAQLNPNFR
jgi:hypothetical protein